MPHLLLPIEAHPDFAAPKLLPTGPVEIDWDNPITKGLRVCILPGAYSSADLVSGKHTQFKGGSFSRTRGTIFFDNDDGYWEYGKTEGLTQGDQGTILAIGEVPSTTNAGFLFGLFDASATNRFTTCQVTSAGEFRYWRREANSAGVLSSAIVQKDTRYIMVGVTRAPTDHELFVDGKSVGTDSTPSSMSVDLLDRTTFGANRDSSPSYGKSFCAAGMYWDRALSDAEIRSISKFPYQVLRPSHDLKYFYSEAASSFQSAWARNSNTILGGFNP